MIRVNDVDLVVCDEFLGVFLDHFFPQELREARTEDFVNLK